MMIIDQQIQNNCPICLETFNENERFPMLVCFQQHLCCKECLSYYLKQNQQKFKCPLCKRADIPLKEIKKFRYYSAFQKKTKSIKENYWKNIQSQAYQLFYMICQQKSIQKCIRSLFQDNNNEANQKLLILIAQGKRLFKLEKISEASRIFKIIIERNLQQDEEFIGLGSYQESVGFYENRAFQWFQKRYKEINVSVYDLLGLCFLIEPNFLMQKAWYERMIQKYSNNFKLTYGLAVIYHNDNQLDQAQKIYKEIIKKNPQFDKPYEMLGFIQLQRKKKKQYFEYVQKCLEINPNNIYAKYLQTRYKITYKQCQNPNLQILKIYNQQTEFVRPLHYLAEYYYQMKQTKQVDYYLDKCIKANSCYCSPLLSKASYLIKDNNFQEGLSILQNLFQKDSLTKNERKQCRKLLGIAYFNKNSYQAAIHYYHLYFSDQKYQDDLINFFNLMISYYRNKEEKKSINKCNELMSKHPDKIEVQFYCQRVIIGINYLNEEYEETIRRGQQYKHKYPQWDHLVYYLGKSYLQTGRLEKSEKCCQFCILNNIAVEKTKEMQQIINQKRQSQRKIKITKQNQKVQNVQKRKTKSQNSCNIM